MLISGVRLGELSLGELGGLLAGLFSPSIDSPVVVTLSASVRLLGKRYGENYFINLEINLNNACYNRMNNFLIIYA